jgi:hypothetical protein
VLTFWPGDTVHTTTVDAWAMSDDFVVARAVDSDLAVKLKDTGKSVQWHLDRTQMIARRDKPTEHLKDYIAPWIPCSAALALPPALPQRRPGRATPN